MLGFELVTTYGNQAAFISAGGYHHHIALNTWESLGGSPPPAGSTGLFHLAILYPTRAELADALYRVEAAGLTLDGASDHGVSEALYLRDPDENGVELYWDRLPSNGLAPRMATSQWLPSHSILKISSPPHPRLQGMLERVIRHVAPLRTIALRLVAAGRC